MRIQENLTARESGLVIFELPSLGNRTYLLRNESRGVLIDPPLAWWEIGAYLESEGIDLEAVVDTHIHNDFISGSVDISREFGCSHFCPSFGERKVYGSNEVREGRNIEFSFGALEPIATPGHTLDHHAYAADIAGEPSKFLFSGGSWLRGSLGRVDLDQDEEPLALARRQIESLHILASQLPPDAKLRPTHGFGSYCSYNPAFSEADTLGEDRRNNPYFFAEDPVALLLSNPLPVPPHFRKMSLINQTGDRRSPVRSFSDFYRHSRVAEMSPSDVLVDFRSAASRLSMQAAGFPSLGVEGPFPVWFEWRPEFQDCNLGLVDDEENAEVALEGLISIGVSKVTNFIEARDMSFLSPSGIQTWETEELSTLASQDDDVIVDLRHRGEWDLGHVAGSRSLPFELDQPIPEPHGSGRLIAYCGSGYRASLYLDRSTATTRCLVVGSPARQLSATSVWCSLPHDDGVCDVPRHASASVDIHET